MICASGLGNNIPRCYMPVMANTLAERIKQMRLSKGLDQTQFGEALGVTQSTVGRWEKGAQPKPEALRAIAKFADMTVDDLLDAANNGLTIEGSEVRSVPLIGLAPAGAWCQR